MNSSTSNNSADNEAVLLMSEGGGEGNVDQQSFSASSSAAAILHLEKREEQYNQDDDMMMLETDESSAGASSQEDDDEEDDEQDQQQPQQHQQEPQHQQQMTESSSTSAIQEDSNALDHCCPDCRELLCRSATSGPFVEDETCGSPSLTQQPQTHSSWLFGPLPCPPLPLPLPIGASSRGTLSSSSSSPPQSLLPLPTFTICQVQQHSTAESAWIVAGRDIYNVTPYLHHHPGGVTALLKRAGGVYDCTQDLLFHTKAGQKVWQQYKIGRLVDCPGGAKNNSKDSKGWFSLFGELEAVNAGPASKPQTIIETIDIEIDKNPECVDSISVA
ncbi:hypothetical protein ACA910_008440 [Epithemia clementina (nom. ined.)]